MKARVAENLIDKIDAFFQGAEGHRTNPDFLNLAKRIAGQEVDLIFIGRDAFEKEDYNYWLPDCCWEAVTPEKDEPE